MDHFILMLVQVLNFIKMSWLSAKISRELLVSQPNLLFNVCFSDFPLWFLKLSVTTISRFLILKYLNQFFRVFLASGAPKRLKIHYVQQTVEITKCQGWCRGAQNSQSLGNWDGMSVLCSRLSALIWNATLTVCKECPEIQIWLRGNSCWMFMSNCRAWN